MVCEVAEYLILSILLIRFLMEKDVFLLFSLSLSLSLSDILCCSRCIGCWMKSCWVMSADETHLCYQVLSALSSLCPDIFLSFPLFTFIL